MAREREREETRQTGRERESGREGERARQREGGRERPTCDGFDGLAGDSLADEVVLDQAGRLWGNLH